MLVSWIIGTNILKATNLQRSMSKISMNSSSDVIPSIKKVKLIFFRFKVGLRDDLRTELLARGVNELEVAYALVQDLDSTRTNHTYKSHDYRASVSRSSSSPQLNRSSTQTPSHKNDIKGMLERDNKNKSPELFKVNSTTKCYKCQGYGHASCPSLVRITIIDGTSTEATELDSDVYIFERRLWKWRRSHKWWCWSQLY